MDRVLIVSADMGEGHNATGRALEDAVKRLWPQATVGWIDALEVMGPGIGPLFRRIYVANVQKTPLLYEFFYRLVWRFGWFAVAAKRFSGAWCGRLLAQRVAEFQPDLVLSTYPMATAGLEWLRRRGRLDAPIGAWVSDFAPHPFWVYDRIDLNLVMHSVAVTPALRSVPRATVKVSAPPVRAAFRPGDRDTARQRLGLPLDAFVALVSCGSLGFGDAGTTAAELLAAHPAVVPVVVCGRNEALQRKLRQFAEHEPRLHVLGWTDRMPEFTLAADVVVTNAGGATGLEALACGRPVVMHRPIAAHGKANARLMAKAGLALVCERDGELADAVRALILEPGRLKAMAEAATRHCESATSLEDGLRALASRPHRTPARPLRPEDALFLQVHTPEVPQQVGAVLVFSPKPDGAVLTREDAAYLFAATPGLNMRLMPGGVWRRPKWQERTVSAEDVLTEVDVSHGGVAVEFDTAMDQAMDEFFSIGVDPAEPCQGRLVVGIEGGQAALLIKLHHAASDGMAVIGALVGRMRGQRPLDAPTSGKTRLSRRSLASAAELARGTWALARAGRAPRPPWNTEIPGPQRHYSRAHLGAADVRAVARRLSTPTTDVVLAVVAEALHRGFGPDAPDRLRVMIPMSMRGTDTFRQLGNHTGAASVDLPLGPMSLRDRVTGTHESLHDQVSAGAPRAGHAVIRAIGVLPNWLHRRLARLVYRGTWFSVIASVLPGARSAVRVDDAVLRTVYPVLSLAPGVPVAVGVMTWADRFTVCVTSTVDGADRGDTLAAAVTAAFADLQADSEADPEAG
jgi:UDP-N-acetylglucosamine:LPS N-acetylglucosamine transferase